MTKIYELATKIFLLVASWLPNEKVNCESCLLKNKAALIWTPNDKVTIKVLSALQRWGQEIAITI